MTPLIMAWMMFSYIPCPFKNWDENKKQEMLLCFPIIGLITGAIWYALFILCSLLNLGALGAVILSISPWCLTGYIHLDGYMDCSDAILSCRDENKRLEILKDSHVGAFAVINMIIAAIISFGVWLEMDISYMDGLSLILIPSISRCACTFSIFYIKPLNTSSYLPLYEEGIKKKNKIIILILIFILISISFILSINTGLVVLITFTSCLLFVTQLVRKLGGMSGDISGASITISEIVGIIALLLLNRSI